MFVTSYVASLPVGVSILISILEPVSLPRLFITSSFQIETLVSASLMFKHWPTLVAILAMLLLVLAILILALHLVSDWFQIPQNRTPLLLWRGCQCAVKSCNILSFWKKKKIDIATLAVLPVVFLFVTRLPWCQSLTLLVLSKRWCLKIRFM